MILSLVFAVVLCAAVGTEAYCPSKVLCKNDPTPCESGKFETQSYTKTAGGEECPPACTQCLDNGEECPDMTCPSLADAPSECQSVDKLYVKISGGRECDACDVAIC